MGCSRLERLLRTTARGPLPSSSPAFRWLRLGGGRGEARAKGIGRGAIPQTEVLGDQRYDASGSLSGGALMPNS
jgi:hypothetical protein